MPAKKPSAVLQPTLEDPAVLKSAMAHLKKADPVIGRLIGAHGKFTLEAKPDIFKMLLRSVVGQQLSTRVARTIWGRVEAALRPGRLTAQKVIDLGEERLRACGLSGAKTRCILDLAQHVADGRVKMAQIRKLPDDEITRELLPVWGIGPWTVHMLLIFGLARPDVLPVADLGIRVAVRNQYGLKELPTPAEVEHIAAPWRPYATVASWYLWRSLDAKPPVETSAA